jgi:hypothetical protein
VGRQRARPTWCTRMQSRDSLTRPVCAPRPVRGANICAPYERALDEMHRGYGGLDEGGGKINI